jgi:hypothetical protein
MFVDKNSDYSCIGSNPYLKLCYARLYISLRAAIGCARVIVMYKEKNCVVHKFESHLFKLPYEKNILIRHAKLIALT